MSYEMDEKTKKRKEQENEMRDSLVDFVIRASKPGASPAELAALPEIAKLLLEIKRLSSL